MEIYNVFLNIHNNYPLFVILYSSLIACLLFVLVINTVKTEKGKNLPPGNLGLPIIGETFSFMKAFKYHKGTEWISEKVAKYGPVFKTSLMGCPTVLLTGPAGNRFLFQNDGDSVTNMQNKSLTRILGENSILELSGAEHKRIRGALMQFLQPEALQKFVGRMDSHVRHHLVDCWEGKESIIVVPLTKEVTFQIACDLLFGLKDKDEVKTMLNDFIELVKGCWSLPLNFPGTSFHRGLKAGSRIRRRLRSYLETRKWELQQGTASPRQDLLSSMLSMKDENNKGLTEEEIFDNMLLVMAAGHDTTASLFANMVRLLALYPNIHENIYKEQMGIAAGKKPNESLRWEDIQKMKYTWKAAQDAARLFPSVFGAFRKTMKDVEYGGYTIPKGWQFFWNTGVTHMNEEIFKEPKKFDPSHFDGPIPPYNFVAFGGGHRMCPGYEFSKMETLIYMHYVVCNYKWSMVYPDESIIWNPSPNPAMGLPIKVQSIVK